MLEIKDKVQTIKLLDNLEDKKEKDIYKITVRLPKEARKEIKDALKVCGYKDVTYWIWRCYERLLNQKDILIKQRERCDKNKKEN